MHRLQRRPERQTGHGRRVVIGVGAVNGERSLRRGCGGLLHDGLGINVRGIAAVLAGRKRASGLRGLLADFGKLASGIGDEVVEQVAIILARLLAIVLEFVDGVDDLLAIVLGLVEDAVGLVLGVLDRGGSIGLGVGQDLVGGALGDDERLGDGVAVSLLGLELLLKLGDAGVALGDGGILFSQNGRVDGSLRTDLPARRRCSGSGSSNASSSKVAGRSKPANVSSLTWLCSEAIC